MGEREGSGRGILQLLLLLLLLVVVVQLGLTDCFFLPGRPLSTTTCRQACRW